jgi:pyrophosphatase PpaX
MTSSDDRIAATARPYVAVLFDLDGTLIDTTDLIFQSYQHALVDVLNRQVSTDDLLLGYGQPLYAAFTVILDRLGVTDTTVERRALVDRLIATYRAFNVVRHDSLAREFSGVSSTLAELERRGYALGLVTSKSRSIGEKGLRLIEAENAFRVAVYQDDTDRHKPHPDPLWVALDRLGLRDRADQVLYVGDSTHDVRAGRAAGVQTAAALWGPFPPESLRALAPDHVLTQIEELLTLCPGT